MTEERLNLEKQVLASKLPSNAYVFKDMDTPHPKLLMAARTNRGNIYTIKIELDNYPNSMPEVYVTKMLKDKDGNNLDSASASMHCWGAKDNCTHICHGWRDGWSNMNSLFKVYVKSRLWLEMYDLHLQTGNSIDYYLKHQATVN